MPVKKTSKASEKVEKLKKTVKKAGATVLKKVKEQVSQKVARLKATAKRRKVVAPKSTEPETKAPAFPSSTEPPKHHRPQRQEEKYALPQGYGEERLVLLPRDPDWIYSYWEITQGRWETTLRQNQGQGYKLVLRVYDVTDIDFNGSNAHGYNDVEVDGLINNWYYRISLQERHYCAEIGLRMDDGRFITFARSNTVFMPRARVSPYTDEEWMVLGEEWERIFDLSGGRRRAHGSEEWRRFGSGSGGF